MKHLTMELPAFWASALINGDVSGMEDEDEQALDKFTAYMVAEYGQCWAVDVSEESSFTRWHDAQSYGVLACDCAVYTFDVTPRGDSL